MLRALIFDVGGTLETEAAFHPGAAALVRELLRREGIAVEESAWHAALVVALERRAPDIVRAAIWSLADREAPVAHSVWARFVEGVHRRALTPSLPGLVDLLASLQASGYRLGALDDSPSTLTARIDALGLDGLFDAVVSGVAINLAKPDPRLWLALCAQLAVEPPDCLMVGDRFDLDLAPARRLGMRTLLLRLGPAAALDARDWTEMPDATADDADELAEAIDRLAAR